jgi:hypothetical protein
MACCGADRPPGAHGTLRYALVLADGSEQMFESYEAAYMAQAGQPGSRMVARQRNPR